MKYIDLSHDIQDGLITNKGLPAPIICDYLGREESQQYYEDGTTFHISLIDMVSNTGTYIDCPFHRYEDGKDLLEVGLEAFVDLETIVIYVPDTKKIDVHHFQAYDLKNKAVLVRTDWSKHWNTIKYFNHHPYLTEAAATFLRDSEVKLVGIDSHSINDTRKNTRPVHSILLKANILIVEHLCNLISIPISDDILFSATPPKLKGVGTFPVRAFVKIA